MSRIRGNRLRPEVAVKRALRRMGVKYRGNVRSLPGSPDAVLPDLGVCVFVHGCFWHGCPRHYRAPRSNCAFWMRKLESNRRRDARVERALRRAGWSVVTIWEHDTRGSIDDVIHVLSSRLSRTSAARRAS